MPAIIKPKIMLPVEFIGGKRDRMVSRSFAGGQSTIMLDVVP